MAAFLIYPQSVSVHIKGDNSNAATLRVIERPVDAADARTFEFCMTCEDLQQLREDIATVLMRDRLPG